MFKIKPLLLLFLLSAFAVVFPFAPKVFASNTEIFGTELETDGHFDLSVAGTAAYPLTWTSSRCYTGESGIRGFTVYKSVYPSTAKRQFSNTGFSAWSFLSDLNLNVLAGTTDGDYWINIQMGTMALDSCSITNTDTAYSRFVRSNGDWSLAGSPPCTVDCFSNVLFLPGLMGSRLYKQDNGLTDKELWVSTDDSEQALLALDNAGKSVDSAIHTKNDTQNNGENETGIIDEIFGANIYNSFIDDLKQWKNDDKIITDYAFIPYDWRLSLDDIITNGATSANNNLSYTNAQNFSESFILKKLGELQANSRTGKVTIITHSNGGLVAKTLIQKLKDTNNPLYNQIDKIIFIAVPQVGTPDAIVALLHGTQMGPAGFIMDNDRSRQLAENMSSIYNFLPSAGYFTTVDPSFAVDKVASFEDVPFFNPQISQYGVYVSNETELKNYVLGTDSRSKPSFGDTVNPNIGNSALYAEAESVHQMLDFWQPSPDTKVIQVAGWGEETIAGLDYKTYKEATETLSYKPNMVVDGDGTVVVPSALWMSAGPNVERWWVDLRKYDTLSTFERVHKDIFEVSNLLNFIKSKITDYTFTDPENIVVNNTSTLISNDSRLHYTLHSPLTLGITDTQGRYTGQDPITKEIREEIPGVTYKQIGNVQFISAPAGIAYTVQMQGYQTGNFSLDVDKQTSNTITETTSFQGILSSISTLATMDIYPDIDIASSALKIDQNGDGIVDKTLPATPDGTTIYDITPPEVAASFSTTDKEEIFTGVDVSKTAIIKSSTNVTVTDEQNNISILNFVKLKEKPDKLKLSFNSIFRNDVPTSIHGTSIEYSWKENHGVITDLDTRVVVKGIEKYTSSYREAHNATIIKEKIDSGVVTTIKPGFAVVIIQTEGDSVKVDY